MLPTPINHTCPHFRSDLCGGAVAVLLELLLRLVRHGRILLRIREQFASSLLALVVCLTLDFSPLLEPAK